MDQLNPILLKGSNRIMCSDCNGIFFTQTFVFQKISKFKVGSPEDIIVPIPVHRCSDCGTPNMDELAMVNKMVESAGESETPIKKLIIE